MIVAYTKQGHMTHYIVLTIFACIVSLFILVAVYYACLRNCCVRYKARKDLMISSRMTPTSVDIEAPTEAMSTKT
jgi:hypothetical protein